MFIIFECWTTIYFQNEAIQTKWKPEGRQNDVEVANWTIGDSKNSRSRKRFKQLVQRCLHFACGQTPARNGEYQKTNPFQRCLQFACGPTPAHYCGKQKRRWLFQPTRHIACGPTPARNLQKNVIWDSWGKRSRPLGNHLRRGKPLLGGRFIIF